MPDLITLADDLKNMPDQWLSMQAQQPTGVVPPYLVVAEMQRRQKLRSGANRAQAPQSSVSDDLIRSLQARMPPAQGLPPGSVPTQATPPGMPPPNLGGGGQTAMGTPAPGSPTPPGNMRMPGPVGMADGGSVGEATNQDDDNEESILDRWRNMAQRLSSASNAVRTDLGLPADPDAVTPLARILPSGQPAESTPQQRPVLPTVNLLRQSTGQPPLERVSGPVTSRLAGDNTVPSPVQAGRPPALATYQPFDTRRFPSAAPPQLPSVLQQLVHEAARQNNLDPAVLTSMILAESSGDPSAVSHKGAIGLMQIMPETAADYGITDPRQLLDPATNIFTGARVMSQLVHQYRGNIPMALAAYNAGPGAVQKYKGVPPFDETHRYLDRVMMTANSLRTAGGQVPLVIPPSNLRGRLSGPIRESQSPAGPTTMSFSLPGTQEETGSETAQPSPQGEGTSAPGGTAAPGATAPGTVETAQQAVARQAVAPWEPAEPESVKQRRRQWELAQQAYQPYDPKTAYSKDNLKWISDAYRELAGPPPDYTKYQQALDNMLVEVQRRMNPTIGDTLMQFGAALMGSHSHRFVQALGEAGAQSYAMSQQAQAAARKDYQGLLQAGANLQDKANEYREKMASFGMNQLGMLQQAGLTANRAELTRIEKLQSQYETAASQWESKKTALIEKEKNHVAYATERGWNVPPDTLPSVFNMTQLTRENPKTALQDWKAIGSNAAPAKFTGDDQALEAGIRKAAYEAGVDLSGKEHVTINDIPQFATINGQRVNLQDRAFEYTGLNKAQRVIQPKKEELKAMSPDSLKYLATLVLNKQPLPSYLGANRYLMAAVQNLAADMAKEKGLGDNDVLLMEQMAAKSNQQAAAKLNNMYQMVEGFSDTLKLNSQQLLANAKQVSDLGAPVLNMPMRELQKNYRGDTRVSNFIASLLPVQKEIARILNTATMNGEVTQQAQGEIRKALGEDFTFNQLQSAMRIFLNDVSNRHMAYGKRLYDLQHRSVVGNNVMEMAPINENEKKLQDYMQKFNKTEDEARKIFADRGIFVP